MHKSAVAIFVTSPTQHENSIQAPNKVAQCYNIKHQPNMYQVGDMVLYRIRLASSKASDISSTLLLRWSKPIILAKATWPNISVTSEPQEGGNY